MRMTQKIKYTSISQEIRPAANDFLVEHWYSTDMVIRGAIVDLSRAEGFAALEDGEIIGLVTYQIRDRECEVCSLDSVCEGHGIGTRLLELVVETAKDAGWKKVKLITTNDNLEAIGFYQKRGFRLVGVHRDAMQLARQLKPSIPNSGRHGIPLRDEIELEFVMDAD